MERTSSPIRSKNFKLKKTENYTGYEIFANNLQCKPDSYKVRGISKPLNDVISGHLVPLSSKYKPQKLERVIILPTDRERNALILIQRLSDEIMELKKTSDVNTFWLLKKTLKKFFSKKKGKKVEPINYYGENSELEHITERLLEVKYIAPVDESEDEEYYCIHK